MAVLSLLNAAGFVNLMGSVSTLADTANRLLPRGEDDQGRFPTATPPADAPGATPPITPTPPTKTWDPGRWVKEIWEGQTKSSEQIAVDKENAQRMSKEAAEARKANNVFNAYVQGFGLRALFIFGGAFLTGLGVIFMLREARPNETAEFGDKLADALTKEK